MENGSIWGHGAYLGPDFSAQYLHNLVGDAEITEARNLDAFRPAALTGPQRKQAGEEIRRELKQNRYEPSTKTLPLTDAEVASFRRQLGYWADYFAHPRGNRGLPENYITDSNKLRDLTAFFAWTAWASVANRPGKPYSYTNNFRTILLPETRRPVRRFCGAR